MQRDQLKQCRVNLIRQLLDDNLKLKQLQRQNAISKNRDFYNKTKHSKAQVESSKKLHQAIREQNLKRERAAREREKQIQDQLKGLFKPSINKSSAKGRLRTEHSRTDLSRTDLGRSEERSMLNPSTTYTKTDFSSSKAIPGLINRSIMQLQEEMLQEKQKL